MLADRLIPLLLSLPALCVKRLWGVTFACVEGPGHCEAALADGGGSLTCEFGACVFASIYGRQKVNTGGGRGALTPPNAAAAAPVASLEKQPDGKFERRPLYGFSGVCCQPRTATGGGETTIKRNSKSAAQ